MNIRSLIRLWSMIILIMNSWSAVHAQLAITEVMSSASTNLGATRVDSRSDFWELTNFGTNALDLTDYRFSDNAGIDAAVSSIFQGVTIHGGESIIFAQFSAPACTNASQFRAWWGNDKLPPALQIYFYAGHGFGNLRDAVQLWQVSVSSTTLVHRVELYVAARGFSFDYDPITGILDGLSTLGETKVFKAAQTDDIGSPGYVRDPVPLAVIQEPQGYIVDAGSPATLSVRATGLPVPRYQWRFNGTPLPDATANTFNIQNIQPSQAGNYTVEIENGLMSLVSKPAEIQVNTIPSAPYVVVAPADVTVTPGQTAEFKIAIRGYPLPVLQWQYNGADLTGETNHTLLVGDANFNLAGNYTVHIQNPLGFTNVAAILKVERKPHLVITEMMGGHSTNTTVPGHGDWWELTNMDTNEVNLKGYRFDDNPGELDGAAVVTNNLIMRPGESVLFVQDMTPEAFTSWWGEENLPEGVQFVPYTGNGFQSQFDALYLWNATAWKSADLPENWVTRAEYVNLNPDFTPVRGRTLTFWCDAWLEFGEPSVLGQCGAIRAVEADDIGSPGYITNHGPRILMPKCLGIFRDASGTHLSWKTQTGKRYELQHKETLSASIWTSSEPYTAGGTTLSTLDSIAPGVSQRFYRLQVLTETP